MSNTLPRFKSTFRQSRFYVPVRVGLKQKHPVQLAEPDPTQPMYRTREVMLRSGVSARTLQWWDERGIVQPKIVGHTRWYSLRDLAVVSMVHAFRKRGLALERIKPLVQALAKQPVLPKYAVLVKGGKPIFSDTEADLLRAVLEAAGAIFVVQVLRDAAN